MSLTAGGAPCGFDFGPPAIEERSDGAYLALPLEAECAGAAQALGIGYDLFFDIDARHRGRLSVALETETRLHTFSPGARATTLGDPPPVGAEFAGFLRQGVVHILGGVDHLLFLLSLLLTATLIRENGGWRPVGRVRDAVGPVAGLVTAFTVAHSTTLALAGFGLMTLPPRLVEVAIAATVIAAALNVVWPAVTRRLWLVAFAFGLVHGFGFAGVLGELELSAGGFAASLLAFNLGVELGQLAIVLALMPALMGLARLRLYRTRIMPAGAGLIALVGGVWLAERALTGDIVGFL